MKKYAFLAGIFLIPAMVFCQPRSGETTVSKKVLNYTLSGMRHGAGFFPEVRYECVEYKAGDSLTFNIYHSLDVIETWMKRWEEKFPGLVTLYEVGESYEGRPIMQMTFTNKKIGKDTDKPAAFFEGGRHSGEVTGTESVLFLAKYLLDNYGTDPEVTHLLDTKTIYLRPVNNPDGHNLYLRTAQSNRSTVRPFDDDGDGMTDEDPMDDLDSNGIMLTMRWKDDKKGTWISEPDDSTGRIMKRVPAGKGIWLTSSEGIDNDGDGRINEDGIGGLDLHRNYPENWRPSSEETGRGYIQRGSGESPLSENETYAVVLFLLSHPNVYVVNSMDTSVPMHLRPPSTSGSEERMYPEDLEWYKLFDKIGKEKTGYEKAGDVYGDYGDNTPIFGHGPDFGYWYFGSIWYGDELWNNGRNKDYDNNKDITQIEVLRWDDEENGGQGFHDWKAAKHPVHGDIEMGGFDPKFFNQNPPASFLKKWAGNQAMFNLELMMHLPELAWDDIDVKKTKSYKADSADFQVKVTFSNTGKLPTALKQAQLVKIVKDDRVVLDFDTAGVGKDRIAFRLIEDKKKQVRSGRRNNEAETPLQQKTFSKDVPFTAGGSKTTAIFVFRVYGQRELNGKVSVSSTRGGVLKDKGFVIK